MAYGRTHRYQEWEAGTRRKCSSTWSTISTAARSPGAQGATIEFAIGGIGDTIDLDPKNAKAFRKSRDRYVAHATRTGGRQRTHITRPDPTQTRAIRELARANGYELADRGRIPTDIVQAYHASN